MVNPSALTRLRAGLEAALARVDSDPESADDSILRLVRAVSAVPELPEPVMAAAREALEADADQLFRAAADLLAAIDAAASPTLAKPRLHVLLVEANDLTADLANRLLSDAGYRVTGAREVSAARAVLEKGDVDVLVVDVFLPDVDGRDLVLEYGGRGLPVVIVLSPTHSGVALARSECLALGADAFLRREEVARMLVSEIEAARDRAGLAPPSDGLVGRGRLSAYFREELAGTGGSVVLLDFSSFRSLSAEAGDQVDVALREIAIAIVDADERLQVVGRWSPAQLVVLAPETPEDEAVFAAGLAVASLSEDPDRSEIVRRLATHATGGAVGIGRDIALEESVQRAAAVRIGTEERGARIGDDRVPEVPRVFFVEDDPITWELVNHKLRASGFEVEHHAHGDDAAAALDDRLDFDLAILDIKLPGQDGHQLLRKIRAHDRLRFRPVLILTGMEGNADVVRAMELGADDYILKPFSPVELTARVRRLISVTRRGAGR